MKKALEDKSEYTNMTDMKWAGLTNPNGEVIPHFPPQLIIGKLTTPEELLFTHDDDETVRLEFKQVQGEYIYGAPTGMFNLSIPDVKRKPQLAYQQPESYAMYRQKLKELNQLDESKKDDDSTTATEKEEDLGVDENNWETNKQVGPLFLRVHLDFKLPNRDVKVWYKLSSKSGNADNLNVVLPESKRKVHLTSGHKKLCESLRIKDPSKGYFFKDLNDVKVEMEVTITRDLTNVRRGVAAPTGAAGSGIGMGAYHRTGGKSVQISDQVETTYYGHDDDDVDYGLGGDDAARYAAYQEYQSGTAGVPGDSFTVTNFGTREIENVLALNMGALDPQDNADRRSNSSTDAVGGYQMNDDIAGDLEGGDVGGAMGVQTEPARCPNCAREVSLLDESCPGCEGWLGSM